MLSRRLFILAVPVCLFMLAAFPAHGARSAPGEYVRLFQKTPDPPAPPKSVKPPHIHELTPIKVVDPPKPPVPIEPVVDPAKPLPLSTDRFRWFEVADYTGPVTWDTDNEDIITVIPADKADSVIGRIEGSDKAQKYPVPVNAGVVTTADKRKEGLASLRAYGVVDGKAKRLDTIAILVGPQPPPPTPVPAVSLSAISGGTTSINLSWPSAGDGLTYKVEKSASSTFVEINSTSGLSFTDSGLTPATTYAYRVRAVNAAGQAGAYGSATATTLTVPPTPVNPPPIADAGFRVMFVWETSSVTPAQANIINSTTMRTYLNGKCAKGIDGKTPEYRMFDKDVTMSGETELWKKAMGRPRTTIPWILISNGKTGFEGPLPATLDETMTLIKKYAEGN